MPILDTQSTTKRKIRRLTEWERRENNERNESRKKAKKKQVEANRKELGTPPTYPTAIERYTENAYPNCHFGCLGCETPSAENCIYLRSEVKVES